MCINVLLEGGAGNIPESTRDGNFESQRRRA